MRNGLFYLRDSDDDAPAGSIANASDPTWGFYAGLKISDNLTGDRFLVDPHYVAWIWLRNYNGKAPWERR